jgi:pimeloyl-ACP methyl ester carboxylesterase
MIQGADDRCDEPSASANQERFFTGGYQRVLLDGVGHFPHREASGPAVRRRRCELRSASA